ncbi:MAG TPA: hypothetical protein VFI41_04795 [Gemmatimonadales bacterium]|nr:hypothetical protein [Gemmatimonadales bacterium]
MSGVVHAGKDTIAGILLREHGFKQKAFGAKVKECALAIDPIVGFHYVAGELHEPVDRVVPYRLSELIERVGPEKAKENPEVRRLYQRVGTEMGRDIIDPELWIKLAFRGLRPQSNIVISDVRLLNEAQAIHKRDGYVWRVIRPGAGLEGELGGHRSETELNDDTDGLYDEIIHNDGTIEDLAKKVTDAYLRAGGRD